MTKEEILDKHGIGGGHWEHREAVLAAMEEYREQSAEAMKHAKSIFTGIIEQYDSSGTNEMGTRDWGFYNAAKQWIKFYTPEPPKD